MRSFFLKFLFGEKKMECIFAPVLGLVVQLVRIPACHAGGRGFESVQTAEFKSAQQSGFFYVQLL